MISYSLKEMGDRPKGTEVALPIIEERAGSVVEYRKALYEILRRIAEETRRSVIPRLREDRGLIRDAANENWFRRVTELRRELERNANETVTRVLNLEKKRHTERFIESARVALGVDVRAFMRQNDLDNVMEAALNRNASLITSLTDDAINRVKQAVYAAAVDGTSLASLRKQLTKSFGIAKRRAELIARDQLASFNADLNETRQKQAGIADYNWRTSQDERVRPLHRDLNGERYKWGRPTGAENGAPPGKPIRCRCVAQAIVRF